MTKHVEWMDVPAVVRVAAEGRVIEGRRLDDGDHALVFDGDDTMVITGPRDDLIRMLAAALNELARL